MDLLKTQQLIIFLRKSLKQVLDLQKDDHSKALLVSRKKKPENTIVTLKGEEVGDGKPHFVFGPCAVESYEQVATVAKAMKEKGLKTTSWRSLQAKNITL